LLSLMPTLKRLFRETVLDQEGHDSRQEDAAIAYPMADAASQPRWELDGAVHGLAQPAYSVTYLVVNDDSAHLYSKCGVSATHEIGMKHSIKPLQHRDFVGERTQKCKTGLREGLGRE
jgi:hypothetical protein